jgi:hypothetical protein
VTITLNRVGFPHVYARRESSGPPGVPLRVEVSWRNDLVHVRNGQKLRCVFVASRQAIASPRITSLLDAGAAGPATDEGS